MIRQEFEKALKGGYAIGAFNFASLEMLKSIVNASEEKKAPVLACASEGAIKYIGEDFLHGMIDSVRKNPNNKVFFHLDHGKSFELCKIAVDMGFDSVMIDGSSLPFAENVKLTKQVVDYAHSKGIFVEGEIGVLAGIEENVSSKKSICTNPLEAKDFVLKTNVDMLAVAIGTSHGAYKFPGEAKLNFEILKQIEKLMPNLPLVLHGASSVYEEDVKKFNKYGGTLKNTKGVPDEILKRVCMTTNVCKINTDTDLRIAYLSEVRKNLFENTEEIDIRKINKSAITKITELVKKKIELFGI